LVSRGSSFLLRGKLRFSNRGVPPLYTDVRQDRRHAPSPEQTQMRVLGFRKLHEGPVRCPRWENAIQPPARTENRRPRTRFNGDVQGARQLSSPASRRARISPELSSTSLTTLALERKISRILDANPEYLTIPGLLWDRACFRCVRPAGARRGPKMRLE